MRCVVVAGVVCLFGAARLSAQVDAPMTATPADTLVQPGAVQSPGVQPAPAETGEVPPGEVPPGEVPRAAPGDSHGSGSTIHRAPGLRLGLGLLNGYAGLIGAQIGYAFPVSSAPLQLAPFAAVGWYPGEEQAASRVEPALGLLALYGLSNRLFIEVSYGPVGFRTWSLHNTPVAVEVVRGGTALIGYEYLFAFGFFFRGAIGGALADPDDELKVWPAISTGMGWKLW